MIKFINNPPDKIKHLHIFQFAVLTVIIMFLIVLESAFTKTHKDALWQELINFKPRIQRNIFVVIPSYNNKDWYQKNLDSVFMQKYPHYHIIYIDDCSSDGTGELVERYIKNHRKKKRISLIRNKERNFALANIYGAMQLCTDDNAIAIVLDGDDWLKHDHVFSLINKVYDKYKIWMTYGQYEKYPTGKIGDSRQLPEDIITTNSYRKYRWVTSHLRTYYNWLFKRIKKEDLLYKGNFFPAIGDTAVMFPLLEMAGKKSKFIPDIIYVYNKATPLNDKKVVPIEILSELAHIVRQKTPYQPLLKKPLKQKTYKKEGSYEKY